MQSAQPNQKKSPIKLARAVKKSIRLPDIDWVEIPSGEFIYGEASAKQTLKLDRFFISRHPITNCQYQTFNDAGDYANERKRSTRTHTQEPANTFFSDQTQAGKKIIVTTGRLGIIDSRY